MTNGIPHGAPEPATDAHVELKKLCDGAADMLKYAAPMQSRTLFPGNPPANGVFVLNGNPRFFNEAKERVGFSGNFLILVCASYRFVGDSTVHQTGIAYALFKPNDRININGETVPQQNLGFTIQPLTSNITT
jgi:hypothetical protein